MGRPPLPPGSYGQIRTHKQIRHDANGREVISWRAIAQYRGTDGHTQPVERRGRTETAARRALLDHLKTMTVSARNPSATKIKPDTRFSAAADLYVELVARKKQLAGTSLDRYKSHIRNHLKPRIGGLQIREFDVPVLEDLIEKLSEEGKTLLDGTRGPLASNTLRQVRVVVQSILQLAVRHGALADNPAKKLSRITSTGPRRKARALMGDERWELLDKLDADKLAVAADLPHLLRFLAGTGVRIGEALGVRWDLLNLTEDAKFVEDPVGGVAKLPPHSVWINGNIVEESGQGLVRHEGKTYRANRVIEMPMWLVAMLVKRWDSDLYDPTGPVFPSEVGGWRWPANTRRAIRGFRERAELVGLHSHIFRKTVATVLDEMGLTARQIADYLGHAQVSMTQDTYMGRGAVDPAAAQALDRALGVRSDVPAAS